MSDSTSASRPGDRRLPEDEQTRALRYDPAFHEAVEAGHLTPRQAFERGKRDVAAAVISKERRLSMEIAFAVVENRISLHTAIGRQKTISGAPDRLAPQANSARLRSRARFMIALGGIVLASALLFLLVGESKEEQARITGGDVTIATNDDGQVVRIEGRDPVSVLEAYCERSHPTRLLEPLGLSGSAINQPGLTLGFLRDPSVPEERLAIYISMNRSTRRWAAGNGRSPLVAFQAPYDSEGTTK